VSEISPVALFLIDGLRHKDHQTEAKITPELGFRDVEASLFTGQPVSVHGRWTDYVYGGDCSPFVPVAKIPGIDSLWKMAPRRSRRYLNFLMHRLSTLIHGISLPRSSLIPPGILAHSMPAQPVPPDSQGAYETVESIFDILRRRRKKWLFLAPPRISFFGSKDILVEKKFFSSLSKDGLRDFYYIKLGDLDRISHIHGPDSPEASQCLNRTMRRVKTMVSELSVAGSSLRWLLISDHGFLPVTGQIVVPDWLNHCLATGEIIHYFVDSTILRVWLHDPTDPGGLKNRLEEWGKARPLGEDTRHAIGLEWGSPQLGHIAFTSPHGSVFWPDFFSSSPPAGMHGYLPHEHLSCPVETHGLPPLPTPLSHTALGAWLKEILST